MEPRERERKKMKGRRRERYLCWSSCNEERLAMKRFLPEVQESHQGLGTVQRLEGSRRLTNHDFGFTARSPRPNLYEI